MSFLGLEVTRRYDGDVETVELRARGRFASAALAFAFTLVSGLLLLASALIPELPLP